jgi:cephalosporin hydroxylase
MATDNSSPRRIVRKAPVDYPPVDGRPVDKDREFLTTSALFSIDTVLGWVRQVQRRALLVGRRRPAGRYVDIRDRVWATDLGVSRQLKTAIQESKQNRRDNDTPPIHWKGVLHMKDPFSLACYPLVIQEVRPRTIIEIGSYHGGSALWLADILGIFGLEDTHVHSFDVNLGRIAVEDPRITFHRADSTHVEDYAAELLLSLPHPWLLIEDAHVNVYEVLTYFDRFLQSEDFIIIEDTLWPEFYPDLKRFLLDHNGQYLVDTTHTDLFGYNVTWHLNGYIRKMRD